MQEILVEKIQTDKTQSRAAINKDYVTELVELLKSGKKLPPVDVYKNADGCFMADGFHRLMAHIEAGKKSIRAEIHKGGLKEARWHSSAANVAHGLKRSPEDKRHAVKMALEDKPNASDQLIADHVGVSRDLVGNVRRASTCGRPQVERIGVDGKTRRLPPPQPTPQQRYTQEKAHEKPKVKPPPPPGKPAAPKDELGHPIPDHVQVLFDRVGEVQELLTALSNVRGVIRAAADDPLYFEVNAQSVATGIAQAYDAIKATTPYCVCPWCHGQAPMQTGCNGCAGRGVIGKYRYDNAVPRELKK